MKHEGGLNRSDTNGTPTNYGINQAAHPEVDVTKLTPDQAAAIYKRDYWDVLGGDKIAQQYGPEMSTAVFDTAVMAGNNKALDLLQQSGGDVNKYVQLRADFLNGLLQSNPKKYGEYAKAWSQRNIDLGGPGIMFGRGEGEALGQISPDWDNRNLIGQIFHNSNGSLNKDAILSLLSGLGTMASSPSRYLGASILQGIGGAANTYMAQEARRSDITAKNLENLRQVAMDTMQWNELNGTNLTPQQYAAMMKINLDIPVGATAQDIMAGAYTPTTGSGLRKLTYQEFQNGTVNIGGYTVPMQNDPASLRRFIADNGIYGDNTPIGRQVALAERRLQAIETSGRITDINGQEFADPRTLEAGDEQSKAIADREATAAFRAAGVEAIPNIDKQLMEVGKQAVIFSELRGGAFNTSKAAVQAALGAVGFDVPESVSSTEQAVKIAASQLLGELGSGNLPGGAPAAEINRLNDIIASPDLQPDSIKTILAMKKALLLREKDRFNLRRKWEAENGEMSDMDQMAYEQWFSENQPFMDYYEASRESMPLFAGELGSLENPHTLTENFTLKDVPKGHYFKDPNGNVRGPMP